MVEPFWLDVAEEAGLLRHTANTAWHHKRKTPMKKRKYLFCHSDLYGLESTKWNEKESVQKKAK